MTTLSMKNPNRKKRKRFYLSIFIISYLLMAVPYAGFSNIVELGIDRIFSSDFVDLIKGKKVGLVSHHAAFNRSGSSSLMVFFQRKDICELTTLFTMEHGFYGSVIADVSTEEQHLFPNLKVYSLHGNQRLLTPEIIGDVDVIVYDVQDIGVRSYTFIHVLFRILQEAARVNIPVIVLDRPNPMGGQVIDGPIQTFKDDRAFDTHGLPYCHGMTIGELASFFKATRNLDLLSLHIVPMKGWLRNMSFEETALPWIPTSPQIPEANSAFFYATTGLIGYLSLTSIGIGYTLPFKVLGAPWIDSFRFAEILNGQSLSGVSFVPYRYEPFFGKYKMEECGGVLILITDPKTFKPVETQFVILGILKTLYPRQFAENMSTLLKVPSRKNMFNSLVGNKEIFEIMMRDRYITWELRKICRQARESFAKTRSPYLIRDYEVSN